ncbi:MAG TPA: NEW3 domain-containing protein, partial [Candidatus Thermoplasmatota archaeon]|nr:NEW3 domain-containing protein [Candidatus Thermoplasmatota archaeon]
EALPGSTFRFDLPVSNGGNGQVGLELLPGAVEATLLADDGDVVARRAAGWDVTLDLDGPIMLELDESTELNLRVRVPEGAPAGLYNVSFTTRLSREAFQNLTIPVAVRELSRVEFVGPTDLPLIPGRNVSLAYVARNTGNVEGLFDLRASAPPGWVARVSPERAQLAPGDAVEVLVTLAAGAQTPDGSAIVRLEAQAEPRPATPTDLRVQVARPQLYLGDATATGALRAGELVLVSANVGNRGGIDATNVSVALTVDGRVVDRVLLSRIPVGSTSLATLSWVATQRGGAVEVVIDPDHELSLATREDTERNVQFGSRLGIPAPGLLALLAVAAALATLRPRRPRDTERDAE